MRVVIAEDHPLLRAGLARLFEDGGHQVTATVGDAESLVAAVDRVQPDLAVVDIRMPPTFTDEGAREARTIKERHPLVGVLVLSQHIETEHAVSLVSLGGFERTVEAHIRHILIKFDIPDTDDAHRRVLAVLTYLRGSASSRTTGASEDRKGRLPNI